MGKCPGDRERERPPNGQGTQGEGRVQRVLTNGAVRWWLRGRVQALQGLRRIEELLDEYERSKQKDRLVEARRLVECLLLAGLFFLE
jgi:hypothetical protein